MSHYFLRFSPILLLTLLLTACGQSAGGLYDDYLSRLSNVLNEPVVKRETPAPQSAPRSRDLQLDIPDVRVTPLSYWNLRHCELFRLISERNSILGRVAPPNTVWRYEARVLAAIEDCKAHPDTGDSQQEQLEAWAEEKRAAWPGATWNGTVASPEVRQIWSASQSAWKPGHVPSQAEQYADLQTLTDWARQWPDADMPDDRTFSDVYQRLGRHSTGGQWRRSVQISLGGLTAANTMLQQAIAAQRLCPAGVATRSAEHAQNVLTLFFIGEVQPYLVQLNREGERLLEAFSDLTEATGEEVADWQAFMAGLEAELDSLQQITRDHADYWQTLLAQCDLQIGLQSSAWR
ncbi:MAG: DUF3080 domain-containing protein [Natronospirillum sp.]|uniref:DUF3080 family protein n=1 Tax=Natronospirillum sp. TaxID=2812955 RepID=UPI0025EC24F9|nr:DUF3080 family protein [Natronospirillum sp.]MCH8553158.1 DUF3080 domain-containing protein [Natronospirillum sp.]